MGSKALARYPDMKFGTGASLVLVVGQGDPSNLLNMQGLFDPDHSLRHKSSGGVEMDMKLPQLMLMVDPRRRIQPLWICITRSSALTSLPSTPSPGSRGRVRSVRLSLRRAVRR